MRLGNECAGRTTGYALSAVDATRYVHSFIESGADSRFGASIDKIDASDSLYFVADTDTFPAFDTFFGISNDGFAGRIDRISIALSKESAAADTEGFGKCSELAISISFAEKAIIGMIGEEQFDNGSSGIDDTVGLGVDFHSGTYRKCTRGHEASLAFDFYDTDAAGSCWREPLVVAERWYFNSGTPEGVKEHFALGGIDLATIDFDLDGMGHIDGHEKRKKVFLYIVRHFSGIATCPLVQTVVLRSFLNFVAFARKPYVNSVAVP